MNRTGCGRALITGAAGFVGRFLREHLSAQGWSVVCADVRTPDEKGWIKCDIANRADVENLVDKAGPITHVFHLAAVTFVPDTHRNPDKAFEVNILGTVHLAAALRKYAPDARLVNVSSAEIYGRPQFLPLTEKHPVEPANPYAISKAAGDHYCAYCHHAEGLDVVRMRPFNHSGPGQSDQFVLPSFAHQIAKIETGKREPILRVGNLDAARDFLHVNDVVRAYELAALEGASGEAYNVCSGFAVVIREALEKLLNLSAVDIRVETDPERVRPVDVPEYRGSHDKLTAATGWRPEIPFEKLLADLLEYWRADRTTPSLPTARTSA